MEDSDNKLETNQKLEILKTNSAPSTPIQTIDNQVEQSKKEYELENNENLAKKRSSLLPSSEASQISPGGDQRSSSVAELRRKAQEHSAALLQSLQHVANFQQAASLAGGLNFPLLPPLTLQALQRKHEGSEANMATSKESNSS
ncbi:hypothetical protein NQ314_010345 [Rhamnusium bicolor]|uniref:OAR domain-containing protein n=1 Tax=Rhamnusium bicolor TaxID=1586634 RepID=A0AAV8XRC1_9CUCU|nr:hypothetical protein NQ314_010345 [Rhamnusium bicolor]